MRNGRTMAKAFTIPMLRLWPPRRGARIESIDAEAEALVRDLGGAADCVARRRGYEASSDAIAKDWDRVALAVARKTGLPVGSRAPGRTAKALRDGAAPLARTRPAPPEADDPKRVLDATPQRFRIQYVGSPSDRGASVLKEVEIQVPNVSAAIVAAASLAWPPGTIGLRFLDHEGLEVFERHKADRR